MGSFVEITLFNEGEFGPLLTAVFDKAVALEKIFNLKDPASAIRCWPETKNEVLELVMQRAAEMAEFSEGAFSGICERSQRPDLNGIAKGYIVDCMTSEFLKAEPQLSGLVNAGGDLRFFNCKEKVVDLRLGSVDNPMFRQIHLRKEALATSSPSRSIGDSQSTTLYRKTLRSGLDSNSTVSVVAEECLVADALTKVGLFAQRATAEKCAKFYQAQIMVFDQNGELIDILGDHEDQ